jgi:outer membrane protein assembly factor BamB
MTVIWAAFREETTMAEIVGTGDFKYRIIENWAKLPDGWSFKEVAAVGIDAKDNVYAFTRGEHPIMVFDRDGNFLRSWGEGQYPRAHGVHMGPDDSIYLTDDGGHFVRKCSLDGKVLLELGIPGKPAEYMSGEPFHRCTHTALSPKGEIYVSDGYGNARVHKYSPDGKLLMSWGGPGTNPGEFNIVHNICTDADGWVYVADRENHRVQVFDGNGKYETQWNNLHRPCGLYMDYTRHPVCYIGELGPSMGVNLKSPNLGPRVSIVVAGRFPRRTQTREPTLLPQVREGALRSVLPLPGSADGKARRGPRTARASGGAIGGSGWSGAPGCRVVRCPRD